ncbi:PE-PPE domain-containing protein [Mycobacterium sp. TY815]|uniref:PE family protein n=1 Tax=Mycobacterium sp. TY815 TaxID=3050581 RepID=UPI000FBC3D4F|nr:PE-PPE domain-containing protein [Mycobacterium sp. TY815]MDP7705876.1 PE-PPE domain-containing protein [Mycobacterium sp. TY815]RUP04600.1 MAG: PE-PPE domain-containing protein [Mycobacterium sp.]
MTGMLAQPQWMTAAAADVAGLGASVSEANAIAAKLTTGVPAAAADEISEATARFFNAIGDECQSVMRHAAAFHAHFSQALEAAVGSYVSAELANVASAAAIPPFVFPANYTSVYISGSGIPVPSASYMATVFANFVLPNFPGGNVVNALALFTPAGLYPLTGTTVLTLNDSITQGVSILDTTLFGTGLGQLGLIQPGGKPVVVQGISQGAIIASLEMQNLLAMPTPPTAAQLGFVLLGDPMNPNGGLLARFPNLALPSLGMTFYGATPADTPWPTHIYTLEYDGIADWPQYPLNFLSDLNAFAGLYYVHPTYPNLNPAALPAGYNIVQLPTSAGYTGNTAYSVITIPHLPLLEPLRAMPLLGNPIADLIEPDLRVLVNLGYGDVAHGYSTGPADIRTPFGLFPPVEPQTVFSALSAGTQQGINAFAGDLQALATQPLPPLSPATFFSDVGSLLKPYTDFNTAFAKFQPTVNLATGLVATVPSYGFELFMDGIGQATGGQPVQGLINAIGMPIAATVGLGVLLTGFEALVLTGAWYPSG